MTTILFSARLSASLYMLWGVLHIGAAVQVWWLAAETTGAVQGRLQQNAWHLAMIAALAIIIAVRGNWKNDRTAFFANALLVGLTDVGFITLVLLPGHVPFFSGLIGPLVWLAAFGAGAFAIRKTYQ